MSIAWVDIKRILHPGTHIDVQLGEADLPLPYTVVMVLDEPLVFCRATGVIDTLQQSPTSAMVFIPTARDLCLFKATIKKATDGGAYIALEPTSKAEFLRHRRSIRVKTKDDINYRVQFAGKSNIYKGIAVQDLGRGGIGLVVYAAGPIVERSRAEVRITLPGIPNNILAHGIVSHCIPFNDLPRTYRVGIQFTKISPTDQQLIALYIEQAYKAVREPQTDE
jgi:c-di-GMP-binding flagellar brake protein YcgR